METSELKVYQPLLYTDDGTNVSYDLPSELHSFEVFQSEVECETFMSENGYRKGDYIIDEYGTDDIDGSIVLDDGGNRIGVINSNLELIELNDEVEYNGRTYKVNEIIAEDLISIKDDVNPSFNVQLEDVKTTTQQEEMEVRITFRAELYIKGKSIQDIKTKWEKMPLLSADALNCGGDFVELVSVERVDDESYKEISL